MAVHQVHRLAQQRRPSRRLPRRLPRRPPKSTPNGAASRDPPAAPLSNTREVVPLRCARRTTAPPLLHHPAMYPLPARVFRVETLLGLWCSSPCPGYFSLPCLARSSQCLSGAHPSHPQPVSTPGSQWSRGPQWSGGPQWRSPAEDPSVATPYTPTVHPSLPLQCAHLQSPAFL